MLERLREYEALCDRYDSEHKASGYEYSQQMRELNRTADQEFPTVQKILEAIDPRLVKDLIELGYDRCNVGERIRKARGILRDRDEWDQRLGPDAPSLVADRLHPLIWSMASPIWPTGEFRVAVQQATIALSTHIKAKARSPLRDRALVKEVFSRENPKPGQTRLHLPGDPADETWRSRQDGLHLIAQGAFAGIRNVAAHDDANWDEHEALEHLAVLSLVARWADETAPVVGDPAA